MKDFAEWLFAWVMVIALIAFVVWCVFGFVDSTKRLDESIRDRNKVRGYCLDKGYPDIKWGNGKYYCYNKVTGDLVPAEIE